MLDIRQGDCRELLREMPAGSEPFPDAHFAVMPQALVEPCILAGSAPGDLILDPFAGSGTVGVVALRHGRRFVVLDAEILSSSVWSQSPPVLRCSILPKHEPIVRGWDFGGEHNRRV